MSNLMMVRKYIYNDILIHMSHYRSSTRLYLVSIAIFLLYINDLLTSSNNFKMNMYADDIILYCQIETMRIPNTPLIMNYQRYTHGTLLTSYQ